MVQLLMKKKLYTIGFLKIMKTTGLTKTCIYYQQNNMKPLVSPLGRAVQDRSRLPGKDQQYDFTVIPRLDERFFPAGTSSKIHLDIKVKLAVNHII
jgi:hypothetical protein